MPGGLALWLRIAPRSIKGSAARGKLGFIQQHINAALFQVDPDWIAVLQQRKPATIRSFG